MLIVKFLRKFVRLGTIVVIGPSVRSECISVTDSPQVTIRLKTTMLTPKLLLSINFYLAESYVNGDLVIEQGNLHELLTILMRSIPDNFQPTLLDWARQHLSPLVDRI